MRRAGSRGAALAALAGALALAGWVAARPARAATSARIEAGCGDMPVVLRESQLLYALPHPFLRARTDSVWMRGAALSEGTDYLLDRARGSLRWLRAPAVGETVWVHACWLETVMPSELQLRRYRPLRAPGDTTLPVPVEAPTRPGLARPETPGASLAVNGNKTIAIDFGSQQDAFLRQSLDLAVSGTLAPGVELTGVLTDRNTPLTAQGATQDLQSLDRVLLELKAPHASAALGDISLALAGGEFARLERRLQGVRAEWNGASFGGAAAAASAQGEYRRMQFFGVDGRQGPYDLTDAAGNSGTSVVAGSEVVTLDGARMTRGEAADYFMDYERGRLTFTNRRPVSSASRITVDYQFTVNRFRRNLAAADAHWQRGALTAFSRVLAEADDRGRPLDLAFDATDRAVLAAAGDSALVALGPGVVPGGGDYDTVRVTGGIVYAFAGPDSGDFAVSFARVGAGRGDYADSATVSGRVVYRYAGAGAGSFRIGRALPLPESHALWAGGAALRAGAVSLEGEGAVSKLDRNTLSELDDTDNLGGAGRVRLALEGKVRGPVPGVGSLALLARRVGDRFQPFTRLETPFAQESWGLAPDVDLDRQQRAEAIGTFRSAVAGDWNASLGALRTPAGFSAERRALDWTRLGKLTVRGAGEWADGRQSGRRFAEGGRDRLRGELRLKLARIEPAIHAESDERRFPSDSAVAGARAREAGVDLLATPRAGWQASAGWLARTDGTLRDAGFVDVSETRGMRAALESPGDATAGIALGYQRRDVRRLDTAARLRSDLASGRVRLEDRARGLSALASLEVTSEGESRRSRVLTFVGAGLGSYDATGNFVGRGDYDLGVTAGSDLERVSRAATSARFGWRFGTAEAWRGSRVDFAFESDARRRGDLRMLDALVAPRIVREDAALARGSVLQRLEGEIAPGSVAAAFRLRLERRVTADRSFQNFAQVQDDRNGALRWRARAGSAWSAEVETRARLQQVTQSLIGAAGYSQEIEERAGTLQMVWTPGPRLRAVGAGEVAWSRPAGQSEFTRTVRAGPDVGWTIAARGRIEGSARRAFVTGPPAAALLPSADPAGAPRWEASGRFDWRLRESTTIGLTAATRAFAGRATRTTGRAEVRAFF